MQKSRFWRTLKIIHATKFWLNWKRACRWRARVLKFFRKFCNSKSFFVSSSYILCITPTHTYSHAANRRHHPYSSLLLKFIHYYLRSNDYNVVWHLISETPFHSTSSRELWTWNVMPEIRKSQIKEPIFLLASKAVEMLIAMHFPLFVAGRNAERKECRVDIWTEFFN
jgi:hypothetical protein